MFSVWIKKIYFLPFSGGFASWKHSFVRQAQMLVKAHVEAGTNIATDGLAWCYLLALYC